MRTVVVDSHNEVLPYWFEEYIKLRLPLVVVRIDQHHDMHEECLSLPAREGRPIFDYLIKIMPHISEYAKRKLNEGNFTCPAFHYGIVGVLYHYDPRDEKIDAYGRVCGWDIIDAPKTLLVPNIIFGKRINKIIWDKSSTRLRTDGGKVVPVPKKMPLETFKEDIEGSRLPVIICFDLDSLYGMNDRGSIEEIAGKRLERVRNVLDYVASPVLACIARSQTPRTYVPPELVDHLQHAVLHLIKIKGKRLAKGAAY